MFDGGKLGKSKAFRNTFENPTAKITLMHGQEQIRMGKCLLIYLG